MHNNKKNRLILLLGSNLGDRLANIRLCVCMIKRIKGLELLGITPIYETRPIGVKGHPDYLNCGLLAETTLDPFDLLEMLKLIEKRLGRRNKGKNLPRTIDIDILLWEQQYINTPELKIPHPAIMDRPFAQKIIKDLKWPDFTESSEELYNNAGFREFSRIPI